MVGDPLTVSCSDIETMTNDIVSTQITLKFGEIEIPTTLIYDTDSKHIAWVNKYANKQIVMFPVDCNKRIDQNVQEAFESLINLNVMPFQDIIDGWWELV